MVEAMTGKPFQYTYTPEPRVGDHICYISDPRKLHSHYPQWSITVGLEEMIREMVEAEIAAVKRDA